MLDALGAPEPAVPALPIVARNTHGAGDSFAGPFAACLARGEPVEAALDRANRAAATLVTTAEADRTDRWGWFWPGFVAPRED